MRLLLATLLLTALVVPANAQTAQQSSCLTKWAKKNFNDPRVVRFRTDLRAIRLQRESGPASVHAAYAGTPDYDSIRRQARRACGLRD
jgi:hypothetical protein